MRNPQNLILIDGSTIKKTILLYSLAPFLGYLFSILILGTAAWNPWLLLTWGSLLFVQGAAAIITGIALKRKNLITSLADGQVLMVGEPEDIALLLQANMNQVDVTRFDLDRYPMN